MHELSLRNVCKRFGGLVAVRDVSMDIAHGERRALLGPNGAGKTTLFNLITGDLPVTTGKIILFGIDVTRMPIHRRIGLGLRRTYQTSALFDSLTVAQNLYLAVLGPSKEGHLVMSRPANSDPHKMQRVNEVAQIVGLSNRLHTLAGDLSHGERRQLEVGMALATNPRLMLLDEPAAGLSPEERMRLIQLISSMSRDITLIIVEHDMDVALTLADQVTVLHKGEIIAEGTPDQIASNSLVQQVYLGEGFHD